MSHPGQGMPATPKEIGAVLDLLSKLSDELLNVQQEEAYQTTGWVLRGLVDGFEGGMFKAPANDREGDLWVTGYQVGQSLTRGAGRHL